MYDRNTAFVRAIGGLIVGLGATLMLLAFLITLFSLLSGNVGTNVIPGVLALGLAILMSSTLISCGTILSRAGAYNVDLETVRLNWAALLISMLLFGALGLWLQQSLAVLAVVVILLLILVRPGIIRLS